MTKINKHSTIVLHDHEYKANTYEAIIKLYEWLHWSEIKIARLFDIEEDDVKATICDRVDDESDERNFLGGTWAKVDPDDMSLVEEQAIEFIKNLNNKKENHD